MVTPSDETPTTGVMDENAGRITNDLPLVVLTGPPGAGKSTIGAALAARLGSGFADTDDLIVERAGKPITEIFVDDGEQAFRSVERDVVAEALSGRCGVLSLGGGAVLDTGTQDLLAEHVVVFLDVTLRYAARRSGFDQGRPLMALNPRGRWLALMEARRPIYERVATVSVDTDEKTPDEVVEVVLASLVKAEPAFGIVARRSGDAAAPAAADDAAGDGQDGES